MAQALLLHVCHTQCQERTMNREAIKHSTVSVALLGAGLALGLALKLLELIRPLGAVVGQ
jgi:hypothetical protein